MEALVRALPARAGQQSISCSRRLEHRAGRATDKVLRQAASSRVIANAKRINAGDVPEPTLAAIERSDFYVVEAVERE